MLAGRRQLSLLVEPGRLGALVAIAAIATVGAHLLLYAGASRASAIVTTLCLQIEPVYSLLLAWLVLAHRPTRPRVIATLVLVAGIVLAVGPSHIEGSTGVWFLLAAPLCWQISHLLVLRRLVGVPPLVLASARYIYGGGLLLALWLFVGVAPDAAELPRLLPVLAVQGCILGYAGTLLWYSALVRIDLARATAIVVPSVPLLAFAASFLVLGEVATPRQWLGLLLTAAGVLGFVVAPRVVVSRPRLP